MAKITLGGNPFETIGELPTPGTPAPDFVYVDKNLNDRTFSESFEGKVKVLIAVPSIDTGVCMAETRMFNEKLDSMGDAVVGLVMSRDLPFATNRFCEGEGIENVKTGSDFRYGEFVKAYHTEITDGPFKGLSARAVFVVAPNNQITYTELVAEVGDQPDYDKVIEAVKAQL